MTDCRTEYESRLESRQQMRDDLLRRDDQAVGLRSAVFCVGLLVAWVVLGGWQVAWQFLLVPIAAFIAVVIYHETIKSKQRANQRAIEYYERCLERLDGKWPGVGPDGSEFLDPLHPYAGDLDIFGEGSLFQLLNSPVTPVGAKMLASWLTPEVHGGLPPEDVVVERQDAVRTLRDQTDLRERLAVIGSTKQSQLDSEELQKWLAQPGGLMAAWVISTAIPLGLLGVAALGYWCFSLTRWPLIVIVLVQVAFIQLLRAQLNSIKKYSEHAVLELRRIVQVVGALETLGKNKVGLQRILGELTHDGVPASQSIRRIERTVSQFENMRHNLLIAPLAFLSMTSLFFACAIDHWRTKNGPHVDRWFRAVGELEALLAFSRLHFENPEYCFPKFTSGPPQFAASDVAHPLLTEVTPVPNDVTLSDDCRLLLVSGSNMSGKSTLMRSVGINAVLAWAGAPVFARELKLSRLQVAAAMRVQDSLQTGTSHFFAELKRIQLVVELAERDAKDSPTVLFLLDEILHGTNSHDRLVGARGVIESLLKAGALGLVTTHDLALSDIVAELDTPSQNVHFRDQWVDGQMTFDYHMREGVVPKSNALSLMRLLGLEV